MKILNREKCALVSKLNPLELSIISFLWTLIPWWFCCKSTSLLMMNRQLFAKVITKLKTPPSLHGLQSRHWILLLVALLDYSNPIRPFIDTFATTSSSIAQLSIKYDKKSNVLPNNTNFGDALPSSLKDSNVSLKWKQWKSKELGTCSMACSILKG